MEQHITYRDLSAGPVELCRELCDQLMAYQTEKARLWREILGAMHFENRLRSSFEAARERYLLAAMDGGRPVGYVFAAAETVTPEDLAARPAWWGGLPREGPGLLPQWLETPVKIGELNNLYLMPEYRGRGIGAALMERAMAWLESLADAPYLFVHVSNGNNAADFYARYGFRHSHTVAGGIIEAYYRENPGKR